MNKSRDINRQSGSAKWRLRRDKSAVPLRRIVAERRSVWTTAAPGQVGNRRFLGGFTLIELLAVIIIIGLLAAIMVPTILQAMHGVKRNATKSRIMALDHACRLFCDDMGAATGAPAWAANVPYAQGALCTDPTGTWVCKTAHTSAATFALDQSNWNLCTQWPPVTCPPAGTFGIANDGAHALNLWLTGYGGVNSALTGVPGAPGYPKLTNSSAPGDITTNPPTDMLAQDGRDGYGFRLANQGRVYGPYGGAENFDKAMIPPTTGYPVFVDAWGGTIGYTVNWVLPAGANPNPSSPVGGTLYAPVPSAPFVIWSVPPFNAAQTDANNPDPTTHQPRPMLITNVTALN